MRKTAQAGVAMAIASLLAVTMLSGCTPQPSYYAGTSYGYSASLWVVGAQRTVTGIKFSGALPCVDGSGNPRHFEFSLGDFQMNAEGEFWGTTSGSSAVTGTNGFHISPYVHGTRVGQTIYLEIAGQITSNTPDPDLANCEFFYDSTITLNLVANPPGPPPTTVAATTTTQPPVPVHPADGTYGGTVANPDLGQMATMSFQVANGGTQVTGVQISASVMCPTETYQVSFSLPGTFPIQQTNTTVFHTAITGTATVNGRSVAPSASVVFDVTDGTTSGTFNLNPAGTDCVSFGNYHGAKS